MIRDQSCSQNTDKVGWRYRKGITSEELCISAVNLMKMDSPEDPERDGDITWKCAVRAPVLRMWFEGLRITSGTQFWVSNTEATDSKLDTFLYCTPSGTDAEIRLTFQQTTSCLQSSPFIINGRLYLLTSIVIQPLNLRTSCISKVVDIQRRNSNPEHKSHGCQGVITLNSGRYRHYEACKSYRMRVRLV